MLSVAMCTYNGARYVGEQLQSIANQSSLPCELIVSDDHSTDDTVAIVEQFRTAAPFAVHINVNEERLGVTENFSCAIARCQGDVVALCDQDDVWQPHKVSRIQQVLSSNPNLGAIFSDAEVVDDSLRPLGYRSWQSYDFGQREQRIIRQGRGLDLLMVPRNFIAGVALAFRSSFKELLVRIPKTFWTHDHWIGLMIAAVAELEPIPEPLLLYRQHFNQKMGAIKPGSGEGTLAEWRARPRRYRRDHYEAMVSHFEPVRERLLAHPQQTDISKRSIRKIEDKIRHSKARANLPERRLSRLTPVLKELLSLHYHQYSSGMRSAIKDVIV